MSLTIGDLAVTSPDLVPLGPIPPRHSADGGNQSPRIVIAGAPPGTKELAVIMHDPDAPIPHGFTHWVIYGIGQNGEVDPAGQSVRLGPNGLGVAAYTGPRPPVGHGVHHYYVWAYALDTPVLGEPSREEFLDRYGPHILEQNRLVATFTL